MVGLVQMAGDYDLYVISFLFFPGTGQNSF